VLVLFSVANKHPGLKQTLEGRKWWTSWISLLECDDANLVILLGTWSTCLLLYCLKKKQSLLH